MNARAPKARALRKEDFPSFPIEPKTVLEEDRRTHRRYPIALPVEYKFLNRGRVEYPASGLTVNMSSGGFLFETRDCPRIGTPRLLGRQIQVIVHWPSPQESGRALKLVTLGEIVRQESGRLAVTVFRYDFCYW